MTFAGDGSKIANFDLGISVIFVVLFFWMEKLITSLKSTGKTLFITFIPPYSTYRIRKSLYFLLDCLAQIHILLRFRDKERKVKAQKYSF